mmetsp:Transcript_95018/g.307434  ORF Transcript_95018/g.307434 Transcript_95018/m.307434 type:complete len:426 (+) Transcript_95018:59-1336(+)
MDCSTLPLWLRRGTSSLWIVLLATGGLPAAGVLRYPDGSFESRSPLHVDECGVTPGGSQPGAAACLQRLRQHLLEDGDCNRVICDNIATSTPVEVYANQTDWAPFKNFCGHLQELFLNVFDLGAGLLDRRPSDADEEALLRHWQVFAQASKSWFALHDVAGAPSYANTTRDVLRRHADAVLELFRASPAGPAVSAERLLSLAADAARRLQLLIENVSVNLLLNFHVAQLEHSGRLEKSRNLVHDLYGDVDSIRVVFHEIPGKRWDSLRHLLERLGVDDRNIAMAEVGVEAANTSQRLVERNPSLSYIGVDPYVNNDGVYADVVRRLTPYMQQGRYVLHRKTSLEAALLVEDASLDLIFLDARHDYEAVEQDIIAWRPKVRPGGVLSGHDFSWMFPTVAMAVYAAVTETPEKTIHLAPDGMWWFNL